MHTAKKHSIAYKSTLMPYLPCNVYTCLFSVLSYAWPFNLNCFYK